MKRNYLAGIVTLALLGISGQALAHGGEDNEVAAKANVSEANVKRADASGRSQHSQDNKPVATAQPVVGTEQGTSAVGLVSAQRLADGSLFVPKAVQRQLGLRTVPAEIRDIPATIEFNGKIIADPDAGGRIQAGQSGRIESGRIESGSKGLPTLGQKVTRGQVLAWLRPVANSIERGNQQALLAELESQLAIAGRKAQRYEQLEGAVPQAAIEAAHFDLEALKKRRAAVGDGLNAPEALLAPVSGVISAANVVLGQIVEAKEILFEVVDPARLAVEALAYDPALVEDIASASAPIPGGALELRFVGGGRQLREQALPLLFRVKPGNAAVAVGQPVKVIARTSRTGKGAAVPQAALVKVGAGETAIWIHADAERFVLRKVRSHAFDANTVTLTSGVSNGERVVSEGAGLLAQVR